MKTINEIEKILKSHKQELKEKFNVKEIGIFGSYARGNQRKGSDVDIIVEFKTPIGLDFIELADYIENLVGKKVDIITSEGIRSIRIKEIAEDIKRGVVYV